MKDKFYPESPKLRMGYFGHVIGFQSKIIGHMTAAIAGDLERESRLCNRVGQVRATFSHFQDVPLGVQDVMKEAIEYLKSVGRKVDFKNPDPSMWITTRDGRPRW